MSGYYSDWLRYWSCHCFISYVLLKWKVTIECFFRIALVTNCVVFADLMMLGRYHYLWAGDLYHAWSINSNNRCLSSLSNGVLFIKSPNCLSKILEKSQFAKLFCHTLCKSPLEKMGFARMFLLPLFELGPNGTYWVICPTCWDHCIPCLNGQCIYNEAVQLWVIS